MPQFTITMYFGALHFGTASKAFLCLKIRLQDSFRLILDINILFKYLCWSCQLLETFLSIISQVNFAAVPEVWWDEDETDVTITLRAKRFREWLFRQPEKCLAVVSHAGFLHELLQEQFRNCELKRINWIHRSRRQAKEV